MLSKLFHQKFQIVAQIKTLHNERSPESRQRRSKAAGMGGGGDPLEGCAVGVGWVGPCQNDDKVRSQSDSTRAAAFFCAPQKQTGLKKVRDEKLTTVLAVCSSVVFCAGAVVCVVSTREEVGAVARVLTRVRRTWISVCQEQKYQDKRSDYQSQSLDVGSSLKSVFRCRLFDFPRHNGNWFISTTTEKLRGALVSLRKQVPQNLTWAGGGLFQDFYVLPNLKISLLMFF